MAYNPIIIGGGTEAAAQRVTIASDSTGVLSVDDNGSSLTVDASSLPLPTGASTLAEQQTQTTALQLIDDTVVAQGTALGTTKNSLVGGSVTTAAPTYTNGQINPLNLTTAGALRSDLSTIAGTAPTTAGKIDVKAADGDVYVRQDTGTNLHTVVDSGTVTTVSTVTNLAQLGGAAVPIGAGLEATAVRVTLPTDGTGKVSVVQSTATNLKTQAESYQGGTAVGAANPLQVTLANGTVPSHAVTNAGTFAVQATAVGTVADDATTPGNPVMIGGKAVETDNTDPTSVSAEDDVTIVRTDRNRRMLVNTRHPNGFRGNENNATAQTDNPIVSAPGANLSLYITDIILSNGATAGTILIEEDTASAKTTLLGPYYLGANSGMSKHFNTPVRVTANKDIGYTSATVTTHTVTVCGYTAP